MEKELCYVYGIVKEGSSLKGVKSITHGGLSAIYSLVSSTEFGENTFKEKIKDMCWVEKKVVLHQNILNEAIFKVSSLVPFKFGSVFNSEESVKQMLISEKDQFRIMLNGLENKREWGIKLYYKEADVIRKLLGEEQGCNAIPKIERFSGTEFLLRKKKEEQAKRMVKETLNAIRNDVYHLVKELVSAVVVSEEDRMPKDGTVNFLNLATLIPQESVVKVAKLIDQQQRHWQDKGVKIKISGPWPAYNFVTN